MAQRQFALLRNGDNRDIALLEERPINALGNSMFSTELFLRGHACTAKLAPHPHMTLAQRNILVFLARWAGSLSP
jgi:hypothetical protein